MLMPEKCIVIYILNIFNSIYVGTGKWIIKAFVDSKSKDQSFYIKPGQQRTLNSQIKTVLVPHDMNRKPRSLDDINQWKGELNYNDHIRQ